jgi:hypothetical protein
MEKLYFLGKLYSQKIAETATQDSAYTLYSIFVLEKIQNVKHDNSLFF